MTATAAVTLTGSQLSVSGDVTPDNASAIRSEGERLMASCGAAVVVDLSGLGAAHSVVLSLLLCWARLALERGQQLQFEGAGDRLLSLSALCGLSDHLSGFTSPSITPQS